MLAPFFISLVSWYHLYSSYILPYHTTKATMWRERTKGFSKICQIGAPYPPYRHTRQADVPVFPRVLVCIFTSWRVKNQRLLLSADRRLHIMLLIAICFYPYMLWQSDKNSRKKGYHAKINSRSDFWRAVFGA